MPTGDRHEEIVRRPAEQGVAFALCRGSLETHGLTLDDVPGSGFEFVSLGVAGLVRLLDGATSGRDCRRVKDWKRCPATPGFVSRKKNITRSGLR